MRLDILRAAQKPISLTNIMYESRVSYLIIKRHVNVLIKRGLLKTIELPLGVKRPFLLYQTTDKGLEVLRYATPIRGGHT